jgi:hypothetical protein
MKIQLKKNHNSWVSFFCSSCKSTSWYWFRLKESSGLAGLYYNSILDKVCIKVTNASSSNYNAQIPDLSWEVVLTQVISNETMMIDTSTLKKECQWRDFNQWNKRTFQISETIDIFIIVNWFNC